MAWYVNRLAFNGFGYKVMSQIIYKRDENRRMLKGENGKPIIDKEITEHLKPAA